MDCDVCDRPIDGDPHEPHAKSCPRIDHGVDDCDCDFMVCRECCWHPECEATG